MKGKERVEGEERGWRVRAKGEGEGEGESEGEGDGERVEG